MVRFARAEGSKGSNKKQYEDATPWAEIVSQLETSKKKRKNNQDEVESGKTDGILGQAAAKKKQKTTLQNAFQTTRSQKTDEEIEEQPEPSVQNADKKSKKTKKKGPKTSEPEYTINSEGKRVKVFRDSTERTYFDLPYEESDTMTRYEGMWVKKAVVGELDRLKAALEEEGLDKKGIMRKMMKAKRKAHRELRIELIYEQKKLVNEAAGENVDNDSGCKNYAKEKKNKKKKQKAVEIGNGSLSSPNKESNVHIKENESKQLDEQSTEVMNPEMEQTGGDSDGAEEDDTRLMMISQMSGKVKKRKRDDIVDGSKKKEMLKFSISQVIPSQVNGNEDKEGLDSKTVLTTQDEGKVTKKKKSKKDKLQTETMADQIDIEDNSDDKVTVTPETDRKAKKSKKSKKDKLEMMTVPSQFNNEAEATQDDGKVTKKKKSKKDKLQTETMADQINIEDNSDDKVTVTPQTDRKAKKHKKSKKDKLEMMTVPSQFNNEAEAEDGKKEAVTQPENKLEIELATQIHQEREDENDKEETMTPQFNSKMIKNKLDTDMLQSINVQHETETHKTFEFYDHGTYKMDHASSSQGDFEESELITNFEGYWVLRNEVEALEADMKADLENIYAARTDGSRGELTEEEELFLRRAVKKRKRFYHKKLLQKLSANGKRINDKKKKKYTTKDDREKVVKFDGFFVKKEAADRLHKLKRKLLTEGLSQQEVDKLMQKERRKEERVLKNERRLVCLNCRQPGHMVSACPNIVQADGEGQPSICYTCGSTEHTSSSCNLKKGSEKSFSFATCYICKESGHISRQCPDNPRGLYPKGGACRGCGSVEHLAKDCPDLQKENAEYTIKVGRMKGEELEALDEDDEAADQDTSPSPRNWTKPKVVKFF